MTRARSLRTHLFAATLAVVVLSIGLMLAIGSVLTRRAVERATLKDLAHQADLIAARESFAVVPLARLTQLRPYLARQHERGLAVRLDRANPYLTPERQAIVRRGHTLNGSVRVDGTAYFFAARRVTAKPPQALVLLRPRSLGNTAFYPFLFGLLIAAAAGAFLAAFAAFLLSRRIAGPVARVVQAARQAAWSASSATCSTSHASTAPTSRSGASRSTSARSRATS